MRLLVVSLIVLAGLALRVDAAWQGAPENMPDSAAYERIARGLHEDGEFVQKGTGTPAHAQPATNYSPGLPLAVAGIFELRGSADVRLARILLALLSTAAIPMAWLLASRLAPERESDVAGVVAAAVVAFYPSLIADAGVLLTEALAGTLIIAALLSTVRALDRSRSGSDSGPLTFAFDWILPGLLLGVTAMVRPEYLPLSVLFIATVVMLNRRSGLRSALLAPTLMLVALALVIAPWTFRNMDHTGRVVPLSTGGGQTLFTGSVLASDGDPLEVMPLILDRNPDIGERIEAENKASGEGREMITPERVLTMLAADQQPGVPTDLALARMGRENYLSALNSDPFGLAGYLVRKSLRIWWRGRTDLTGSPAGKALHIGLVAAALTGFALLGLRRRPEFWLILSLAAGVTLIGMLLVASPRRTLALWPVIGSLAGIGIGAAVGLVQDFVASRQGRKARETAIGIEP